MKERIITGLIMIAVMALIVFGIPALFTPMVIVLSSIAVWEWCRISKIKRKNSYVFAVTTATLWLASTFSSTVFTILLCAASLHYLYAIWLIISYEKITNYRINDYHLRWFGPILLAALASSLNYIFNQPSDIDQTSDALTLCFIVMVISGADTGAYFVGRTFGKYKLCPRVSPKKTIEGLLGGLLTVTIVVGVCGFMVEGWYLSFAQLWLISIIAALFSVVGDLFISVIKRHNNIKDSGQIFPGHGGVLDRIDGLLAGIPVFYLLQQFA